jgi:hypothetical protein
VSGTRDDEGDGLRVRIGEEGMKREVYTVPKDGYELECRCRRCGRVTGHS